MSALRFLAGCFLLFATIALVYDVTRWQLAMPGPALTSLAKHWSDFSPTTLDLLRTSVERRLHVFVWDPLLVGLLRAPAAITLGLVGALFGYLGRDRKRINLYEN